MTEVLYTLDDRLHLRQCECECMTLFSSRSSSASGFHIPGIAGKGGAGEVGGENKVNMVLKLKQRKEVAGRL